MSIIPAIRVVLLSLVLIVGCSDPSKLETTVDTASAEHHAHVHHDNELSMPPTVRQEPEAMEMVRAWVVGEQLNCSLRPEIWEDNGTWGVLLADLAHHIANANLERRGIPMDQTLQEIKASFEREMSPDAATMAPAP